MKKKRIRRLGRRADREFIEASTKGKTHVSLTWIDKERYTPHTLRNVAAHPTVKKPWSPIRQACSIVAVFSYKAPEGHWTINPDHTTKQDRKAARQLLRSVGGVVGT